MNLTEEYAKEFTEMGRLERMWLMRDGSLEIHLGNVFRGLKRAVGSGGGVRRRRRASYSVTFLHFRGGGSHDFRYAVDAPSA